MAKRAGDEAPSNDLPTLFARYGAQRAAYLDDWNRRKRATVLPGQLALPLGGDDGHETGKPDAPRDTPD